MVRRELKRYWLGFITTSYLALTLILVLYSFFHLSLPSTAIIFCLEISYLIITLLFSVAILVRINLFLTKIKRTNFKLPPIKIQVSNLTLLAIALWSVLILIYCAQSAWTLFATHSLLTPSFFNRDVFNYLLTLEFSLTIYLLIAMIAIFIYGLIIHYQKGIKIIPNSFWAFELAQFRNIASFRHQPATLLIFLNYFVFKLYKLGLQLIVLALQLNHLRTQALRQFKKETTPPSLFYSHSI